MPLPPGAKLLSLPPGAKLVTAASAPMTETKAPEQTGMISSFVKGLKTFTPPLGAGSVYNEAETTAALNKARTDPAGFLADQIPFVSQIKKIISDVKSGKDKDDVAAEAIGELVAGAAGSPPIMKGGATPATARARYGGGLAETPKPSKPVNVGGLMDMAKTGKDILQVLKSPNPLTKLSALGRLFEKFASEVTPIEAPPAPPVVEAPPVASGVPLRPPLRGKQFGTFNDPTVPPVPAGVTPSGPIVPPLAQTAPPAARAVPIRPPLRGRQFGTTVPQMMREAVPGRQFGAASQAATSPEIVATVPVETPASAVPTTAATLMEEATKPAGKKVPPFDWTDEAQYKEYQKALTEDSNIYGNNRTTMADRVTRFMKKNGIEPTDSGIVKALEQSAEDIAVSPTTGLKRPSFNAADHEVLFDMIKDRMETPAKAESPAASAAPNPPAAVPEVPKAAAKPKLDHGQLNLPLEKRGGGSIDSQLDKYKANQAKAEKAAAKEAAGIRKSDKAIARDLFTQHAQALAESRAAKRGIPVRDSIKLMDSMAKWEPKKLIKLLEKYQADNPKQTTVGDLMGKVKK